MPYTFDGSEWKSNIGLHGGVVDDLSALAANAISTAAASADLLQSSDPRVPKPGDADAFRVLDNQNRVALEVTPTGTTKVGSTEVEHRDYEGLRVYDSEERIAFDVRPDGTTFIGQLSTDSDGRSASVSTVHVLVGMGQSNMSGRGLPISADIDPPDPRIFQYGAHASQITTATVPLDSVDTAYGISPLTLIAREYLRRLPSGDVVLLIPAARGGSSLGYPTSESSSGIWNVAYTGASQDLYAMAKAQITAAMSAAALKWPNATIRKVGMFWHQGEGGISGNQAAYASLFDAIVADLRTHMSASNLPVVLGGMVSEWVDSHTGLDAVRAAHIDTPKRLVYTGYAYPPANGGGNLNLNSDNQVHFHREGLEVLSSRMLLAWDRALRNTTTTVPNVPQSVAATLNGTTLTVKWSQPMCRYTAFTVEYLANGDSWTAIPTTTVDTTAVATITGTNPVQVRVSTTNEYGTSVTSTPVYANIIKEP